jgi:hypothetical protein
LVIKQFLIFSDYSQGIEEKKFLRHMKYALSTHQGHIKAIKKRINTLFLIFAIVPLIGLMGVLYYFYQNPPTTTVISSVFALGGGSALLCGMGALCAIAYCVVKILGMMWDTIYGLDKTTHMHTDLLNKCLQVMASSNAPSEPHNQEKIQELLKKLKDVTLLVQEESHMQVRTAQEQAEQSNKALSLSQNVKETLETMTGTSEGLSDSMITIHQSVTAGQEIAAKAKQVVEKTDGRVQDLAQVATQISQVISLIQEIASQTHLLALNATIEAARAGDSGKGFSVVALEVKNLANETTKATEDIAQHVDNIQKATQETVESIQNIKIVMEEMNQVSKTTSQTVEEQAASAHGIKTEIHNLLAHTQHFEKILEELKTNHAHMEDMLAHTYRENQNIMQIITQVEANV